MRHGRLSPWLDVCLRPREAVRAILDEDPERHVTLLIVAAPAMLVITNALLPFVLRGRHWPIREVATLPFAILAAGVLAFLWTNLLAIVLTHVGRRLGGVGRVQDLRCALAWGHVPLFVVPLAGPLVVGLLLPLLTWQRSSAHQIEEGVWLVVAVVVAIVQVQAVAAAHRFSLECAVYTMLLGPGGIALIVFVTVLVLRSLFQRDFFIELLAKVVA